MTEHYDQVEEVEPVSTGDVDTSGKLAMSLFVGVILLLLILIYALATAA